MVAANAWMNEPAGFTLNQAGKVVDVDPWAVIFNKAMPFEAAHMLVAAYLVGGFLIASVYAMGMLRGRRDRYHRLGFIIPFTVAAIATPVQMGVGDPLARWVYNNEPAKFAAIELVPKTERRARDAARAPELERNGERRDPDPGAGVVALRSEHRHEHDRRGPRGQPVTRGRRKTGGHPVTDGPTIAEANVVHLAWDVMVGLGTLLSLLSVWFGLSWAFRRDYPEDEVVPADRRVRRACSR